MYAIVNLKGHQYIVSEGVKIDVDNIGDQAGEKYLCEEVLAVFDDEAKDVKVGTPFLQGANVEFDIVNNYKGEKIDVIKFKRKNRYKRKIGFRPMKTVLEVKKINL